MDGCSQKEIEHMKKKPKIKKNKYQIAMRVIVISMLLFFIAFSFGFEVLMNGI